MPIRPSLLGIMILCVTAGCREAATGPITISAIGSAPEIVNPNLAALDAPSAILLEAVAQGLVRFDAEGQIEPALAQSWIVSDDGLRYTFRLSRTTWSDGERVTADQVAARLRAAISAASRNPLKPVLGAIDEIEAMTEEVLEISLVAPRPNFLQLLAQPEMALLRGDFGTGPYSVTESDQGVVLLSLRAADDEEVAPGVALALRGERAALAVARFAAGEADMVTGGTLADLPTARAADLPAARLRFDPVAGMLGFLFTGREGPWSDALARDALSKAIDRDAIIETFGVPALQPRTSLVPAGIDELRAPAQPIWAADPLPMRREAAIQALAELDAPAVRVAIPDAPGYRQLFALLRRDWSAIGVTAERVAPGAPADLRLIDSVAPSGLSAWYLRHFTCSVSRICSAEADAALALARSAPTAEERTLQLGIAEQAIGSLAPFIPIAAPVRWSLTAPRLNGFQPNVFGRRFLGSLVAGEP